MQSLALLLSLAVRTTDKSQCELDVVSAAPPRWVENVFLCQQFYSTKVNIFLLSETKCSVHLGKLNSSKDLTRCNTFFADITAINQKDTGKHYFPSVLIYALSPINFEHCKSQENIARKHVSGTFSSITSVWEVILKWILPYRDSVNAHHLIEYILTWNVNLICWKTIWKRQKLFIYSVWLSLSSECMTEMAPSVS